MATIQILKLTVNDLQPYYFVQVKNNAGIVVDLTGATIVATMKLLSDGSLKINRQSTGINITGATIGHFQYEWQSGDTDTAGIYQIEFEITPASGGKFTLPQPQQFTAQVHILDSLDTI